MVKYMKVGDFISFGREDVWYEVIEMFPKGYKFLYWTVKMNEGVSRAAIDVDLGSSELSVMVSAAELNDGKFSDLESLLDVKCLLHRKEGLVMTNYIGIEEGAESLKDWLS